MLCLHVVDTWITLYVCVQVIADLEEEKRRRVQDAAAGDDITAMLEKEQERLLQQVTQQRHQNTYTHLPRTHLTLK